jgi:7,8-dihydroneopterin aldolase/epimerase/oxygenase
MSIKDELALTCRKLFLRNYEVLVNIGVHEFEKKSKQRILFNIDAYVFLENSTPIKDGIDEVLDYDFIREAIANRISRGHIELQETLCDEVTATILAHPKVRAVKVSTEKPDVYPDSKAVGVEVFRMKR